jgi:arylsulfatase A-like enzyme
LEVRKILTTSIDPQRFWGALGLVLMVSLWGACARDAADAEPTPNVVLILLDAARADHFSSLGYEFETTPQMDRLAARGVLFERHYASANNTRKSIPGLFHGRYYAPALFGFSTQISISSTRELFRRPDPTRTSMTTAFRSAGFYTAAISAHFWIAPSSDHAREFHDFRLRNEEPTAEAILDEALAWTVAHRHQPTFLYIHLLDTHFPHFENEYSRKFFGDTSYRPEGKFDSHGRPIEGVTLDDMDIRYLRSLYDGDLARTDAAIGAFVSGFQESGLLNTTILAITSDHGEYVGDGPRLYGHPSEVGWTETLGHIPLILDAPGLLEPARFDGLTHAVDVAPTLLTLSGVPFGEETYDGVDLRRLTAGEIPRRTSVVVPDGIRTERYSALFDRKIRGKNDDPDKANGRLYDLQEDPSEQRDLFDERPDVARELYLELRNQLGTRARQFNRFLKDPPQPESAFALGPASVRTTTELDDSEGWALTKGETQRHLRGRARASTLNAEIRLPDGAYEWSIQVNGEVSVSHRGETATVRGKGESVALGTCTVVKRKLQFDLRPSSHVVITSFGFVPLGSPGADLNDDQLDRLRALGYVANDTKSDQYSPRATRTAPR